MTNCLLCLIHHHTIFRFNNSNLSISNLNGLIDSVPNIFNEWTYFRVDHHILEANFEDPNDPDVNYSELSNFDTPYYCLIKTPLKKIQLI